MSPQVFAILSALIEQRAGLHYAPEDREFLAACHEQSATIPEPTPVRY